MPSVGSVVSGSDRRDKMLSVGDKLLILTPPVTSLWSTESIPSQHLTPNTTVPIVIPT